MDSQHAQRKSLRWHIGLILVIVASWVCGLNYARITPFGPGHPVATAQEAGHLNYVRQLIAGQGLPEYRPEVRNDQGYQPPAYYVVTTAYAKLIGLRTPGHDPNLDLKLRSVGVMFGVLMLFAVYRFAYNLTGEQALSVLATGVLGLSPMFCSSAGSISNATAAGCFATLALASLSKEKVGVRAAVAAGIYSGLAIDTHLYGSAMLLVWLCVLALGVLPRGLVLLGFATTVLVGAPEFARNVHLFGDPFGLSAWHVTAGSFEPLGFVVQSLKSVVGVFASNTTYLSNFYYAPILLVTVGAAAVGIGQVPNLDLKKFAPALALAAAVLVLYVFSNVRSFDGNGPDLLMAGAVGGLLCALGWRRILTNDSYFQGFVALLLLALVLMNAYSFHLLPARFEVIGFRGTTFS